MTNFLGRSTFVSICSPFFLQPLPSKELAGSKKTERWSIREGRLDMFRDFRTQLARTNIAPAE